MITFIFDNKSAIPMYEQLYRFIKGEISSGSIKSGEKLPSKRKLAEHLNISIVTVEGAYNQLLAEGYIRSEPRSGYFVSPVEIRHNDNKNIVSTKSAENRVISNFYKYNFTTSSASAESFPFSLWAKLMRETLSEKERMLLLSSPAQGVYELRKEISEYLMNYRGVSVSPDSIVVGAGSEYLMSIMIPLIGRDKVFGYEDPGYPRIHKILERNDVKCKSVGLDEHGLICEELDDIDVIHVTPSHHFPLGVVMPVQRRMKLLAWANKSDSRYVIEDDYDSEFRFTGKPIPALKSLDEHDKVIYLNTFTRSLAPSLRISYMVLPDSLINKYMNETNYFSCPVPTFEQFTLASFMRKGGFERHIGRMKNICKSKRDAFVNEITKSSINATFSGVNDGLHMLMQVNNSMTEKELVKAAASVNILMRGLSEYYIEPHAHKCPESTVVIGYAGLEEQEIHDAVKLLEKAWK